MKNNQTPQWLENLIAEECQSIVKSAKKHPLVKQAQSADERMKELEAKIDKAETPEELDAIEKELSQLEAEGDSSNDDAAGDDSDTDTSSDSTDTTAGDTMNEDAGDAGDAEESKTGDIDLSDIYKEIKDVKDDVGDEKENIQRKLLNQLGQLNDQLGLNKIVDLNSTIDTGM